MNTQSLLGLKDRVQKLATACRTLDAIFAEGAVQLRQEAEVERLQKMTTRIRLHLEEVELSENGAQNASQTVDALGGIVKLIVKGIGSAMGEHFQVGVFEKTMTARQSSRQHCFGMIMVCIGKGGLPDDVRVVSISERARTQNRSESAIIHEIQESGALLLTSDKFMQLVEGVVCDIRKGNLRLPILPDQLIAKLVPVKRPPLSVQRIDIQKLPPEG